MDDSTSSSAPTVNADDLLKILVATDIHLGYNEKHSLRGISVLQKLVSKYQRVAVFSMQATTASSRSKRSYRMLCKTTWTSFYWAAICFTTPNRHQMRCKGTQSKYKLVLIVKFMRLVICFVFEDA